MEALLSKGRVSLLELSDNQATPVVVMAFISIYPFERYWRAASLSPAHLLTHDSPQLLLVDPLHFLFSCCLNSSILQPQRKNKSSNHVKSIPSPRQTKQPKEHHLLVMGFTSTGIFPKRAWKNPVNSPPKHIPC